MRLLLEDRVVLITGPAKGMGAAITRRFASEGRRLVLIGRDTAAIESLVEGLRAGGTQVVVIGCDLTAPDQCVETAAVAKAAFGGRIDVLVDVAGGTGPIGKTGVETTPAKFDEIVPLNMNGRFHTIRAVLPTMMEQRYDKVVNVGGTFGIKRRAGRFAFSASKWGLGGIAKNFALEASPCNVNCVAPAWSTGHAFAARLAGRRRLGGTMRTH